MFSIDNAQIDWTVGVVSGQVAEISAKFNKKPLVSLEVALDEAHFLKSKYNYNTDAAKDLIVIISSKTCFKQQTPNNYIFHLSKFKHLIQYIVVL